MLQAAIVVAMFIISLPFTAAAAPVVFEASGASSADILATVNAFRTFLGPNNGVGGSFADGLPQYLCFDRLQQRAHQ